MARIRRATVQRATLIPSRPELAPDLPDAVDAEVLREDAPDLDGQGRVASGSGRPLAGISAPSGVGVIGRRGDRQHAADRFDPVDGAMLVDEGDHGFDRRAGPPPPKKTQSLPRASFGVRGPPPLPP